MEDSPSESRMQEGDAGSDRHDRERDFWGHHIPSLDLCLAEFAAGPDPNIDAMIDAVEPVAGARILDFACGSGVTSAWLAARGATVVGVDLSPDSLERAQELHEALGLDATFVQTLEDAGTLGPFDAVIGRYALHHIDVAEIGPLLANCLRGGGKGAFVETFATNPFLRTARRTLPGRMGIPKLGTEDERPLDQKAIASLRTSFGSLEVTCAQMYFLRIFDRQVLRFRYPFASSVIGWIDDRIGDVPGSTSFSYFQVVKVQRTKS